MGFEGFGLGFLRGFEGFRVFVGLEGLRLFKGSGVLGLKGGQL